MTLKTWFSLNINLNKSKIYKDILKKDLNVFYRQMMSLPMLTTLILIIPFATTKMLRWHLIGLVQILSLPLEIFPDL